MNAIKMTCLLAAVAMIVACGESGQSNEPGAATPKALIERMSAAMDAQNAQGVAVLIDAEPEAAEKIGKMSLIMTDMGKSVAAAKEKFGEESLQEAMGFGYMMLEGMSPDLNRLAEDGEAEITGDTATFTIEEEDGDGGSASVSMSMIRKDGRWYLRGDEMLPPTGEIDEAMKQIEQMRDGLAEAVETSDNAQQFSQKVQMLFMSMQP